MNVGRMIMILSVGVAEGVAVGVSVSTVGGGVSEGTAVAGTPVGPDPPPDSRSTNERIVRAVDEINVREPQGTNFV